MPNLASVKIDQELSTEVVDNSVRITCNRGYSWCFTRVINKYATSGIFLNSLYNSMAYVYLIVSFCKLGEIYQAA